MAGIMGHFEYTDDVGVLQDIFCDASNAVLAGMAAVSPAGSLPEIGRNIVPRYRLLRNPTNGRLRRFICGNVTDTLWTDPPGGTVSIFDYYTNAAVNYIKAGRVGEKLRAR